MNKYKLTIDWAKFLKGLAKSSFKLASRKPDEAAASLGETLEPFGEAFGIEPAADEPSRGAAQLLNRATTTAIQKWMRPVMNRLRGEHTDEVELLKRLEASSDRLVKNMAGQAEKQGLELTPDLFDDPAQMPGLTDVEARLTTWLEYVAYPVKPLAGVVARYREHFVDALFAELRRKPKDYESLSAFIDSPLKPHWQRREAWEKYNEAFARRREEKSFLLDYPLYCLFQWPRAYYVEPRVEEEFGPAAQKEQSKEIGPEVRHVVAMREELDRWLDGLRTSPTDQPEQAFKVLGGDPGSGKSSTSREYAYYRTTDHGDRVLYVPLHRLGNFRHSPFRDELTAFFKDETGVAGVNPVEDATPTRPLFIILDGLDELSKQGTKGQTAADQFAEEVVNTVRGWNTRGIRVAVLFCGRPIPVQQIGHRFRGERQVLTLLPYLVRFDQNKQITLAGRRVQYDDPADLLGKVKTEGNTTTIKPNDQREEWWAAYGRLKAGNPSTMPEVFKKRDSEEITAQPMMHTLAAFVCQDEVEARYVIVNGELNRSKLFDRILRKVYDREWGKTPASEAAGNHPSTHKITFANFRNLLSCLGQSAWHGGEGRVTTLKRFRELCRLAGYSKVLKKYEGCVVGGAASLFTAFYVRYSNNPEDEVFEFTHKSFGEYLTAVRLVDLAVRLSGLSNGKSNLPRKVKAKTALLVWLKATGSAVLTPELFSLVGEEVKLRNDEDSTFAPDIKKRFVKLLSAALKHGLPTDRLTDCPFAQIAGHVSRAKHALLCLLGACVAADPPPGWPQDEPPPKHPVAWASDEADQKWEREYDAWLANHPECFIRVDWPSRTTAADLIRRVRVQRERFWDRTEPLPLAHIDFRGQWLQGCDLTRASLDGASLDGASLDGASLTRASLSGASLDGASLSGASLDGANLSGARLSGARLDGASLDGANLSGASLTRASLTRARLIQAFLMQAILSGANLSGASLSGARLDGAILSGARLDRASLDGARLDRAILDGAWLVGASLDGATYDDVRLDTPEGHTLLKAKGAILNHEKREEA